MKPSPAAVEVRKNETTRLYDALIDGQVVGEVQRQVPYPSSCLGGDRTHTRSRCRSCWARAAVEDKMEWDWAGVSQNGDPRWGSSAAGLLRF